MTARKKKAAASKPSDPWKAILTSKGRILPLIELAALKENQERNAQRDTEHLHSSEMCRPNWCPRNSFYRMKGYPSPPEELRMGSLNVFAEGHAIHDKWQKWLWDAGILKGLFVCKDCGREVMARAPKECKDCGSDNLRYGEVPISNAQYRIIGHADGEIEDLKGEALIEIKSVGLGTVRIEAPELYKRYQSKELTHDQVWREIKRPFMTHLRQANLYMFATGVHTMLFVYEWKANQQVKEFQVRFQPHLISDILAKAGSVVRGLHTGIPPMRPEWLNEKGPDNKTCKACPYKSYCWKEDDDEDDQEVTRRSPRGSDDGEDRGEVRPSAQAPARVLRRGARLPHRSR